MFKSSSLATATDGGKSKSREIELSDATWADWAEMIHEDIVDKQWWPSWSIHGTLCKQRIRN